MNYGGLGGRMREGMGRRASQGGSTKTGFQAFPLSYQGSLHFPPALGHTIQCSRVFTHLYLPLDCKLSKGRA